MLLYEELSNKILRAYNNIENCLGKGLAEKVYENALCIEFDEMGVTYERQKPLVVEYKGQIVGSYVADFFLNFSQQDGRGFKRLLGQAARIHEE